MEKMMTVSEVALALGINKQRVYSLMFTKQLGAITREGTRYYISSSAVDVYQVGRGQPKQYLELLEVGSRLGISSAKVHALLVGVDVPKDKNGKYLFTEEIVGILQQKHQQLQQLRAERREHLDKIERERAERRDLRVMRQAKEAKERAEKQVLREQYRREKAEIKKRMEAEKEARKAERAIMTALKKGTGLKAEQWTPELQAQIDERRRPKFTSDQEVMFDWIFIKYPQPEVATMREEIKRRLLNEETTFEEVNEWLKQKYPQ